jgi:hypothetical protein
VSRAAALRSVAGGGLGRLTRGGRGTTGLSGLSWAERLWLLGPALEFPKTIGMGCHGDWAELMD